MMGEPTRRLFFALWPDDTLRVAVARATHKVVRESGGRAVPARNLHATLLFLGSVAELRIPELERIAARASVLTKGAAIDVAAPPQLLFERIEFWEKPRVLVATTRESPCAGHAIADALAGALRRALSGAGLAPDAESKFRPHVTLARKVPRPIPALDIDPVPWSFTQFALVDSRRGPDGAEYSVLAKFALQRA